MKKITIITFIIVIITFFSLGFTILNLDEQLKNIIIEHDLKPDYSELEIDPQKIELGRLLFFDKILSGNKDISCATCHHPSLASADALALSIGVGGKGLGTNRHIGDKRERIPRNSPDIFNRGSDDWHSMFWDNRVMGSVEEGFDTPAEEKLPEGLDNILAVQAMFPVLSRDEMRGEIGDKDINGDINELALIGNASEPIIWHRIMLRILAIPEYKALFQEVYPDVAVEDLGFQHAANAIAAFETAAFTFNDSPWDQYILGEMSALSPAVKNGAINFYGKANCASCHSGALMTDQEVYNLAVPQLGPGKGNARPLDLGRFVESGIPTDLFGFRTPSLKNTAITGPWMHNGAYQSLEEVIQHHLDPEKMLTQFDCSQLEEGLQASCEQSVHLKQRLLKNIAPELSRIAPLEEREIQELVRFLEALTDESAKHLNHLIPKSVPSGLPVVD